MDIGTGIFLSVVFLSPILLFALTKDRWNWKRIMKWAMISVGVVVLVTTGVIVFEVNRENHANISYRPEPQPTPTPVPTPAAQWSFCDVQLGETLADVKFYKGEPLKSIATNGLLYLYYPVHYTQNNGFQYGYPSCWVTLTENKLVYNIYHVPDSNENEYTSLLGFSRGSTYQQILNTFGQPSQVMVSTNDLERALFYDKLNAYFYFRQATLVSYGIYNSHLGYPQGTGMVPQACDGSTNQPSSNP